MKTIIWICLSPFIVFLSACLFIVFAPIVILGMIEIVGFCLRILMAFGLGH